MAADIRFERSSEDDLDEIVEFLGANSNGAKQFAERFDQGIEQLLRFPECGPADETGMRSLYLTGTPFSIVYDYRDGVLRIFAVAHASRSRTDWRDRQPR